MNRKKVLVSGCFDCLHSGHVAFLKSASEWGELYVCIGNDANIFQLKSRVVAQSEQERAYMLGALKFVHEVRVSLGMGMLDFVAEMDEIQPDYFIVNEDGHHADKEQLCKIRGIEYVVLKRVPDSDLPSRSTTQIRNENGIPYRIDLAGGWLDQPFVSKFSEGPVITISVEVDFEVNQRSGMASSTHRAAREIWGHQIPSMPLEKAAKLLFAFDNPPGKMDVSGSQDAIGIVFPGVNYLFYNANYWPEYIQSCLDEDVLHWLEQRIGLLPIPPRPDGFEVLDIQKINEKSAKELSLAAKGVWESILMKDATRLGECVTQSLLAQREMFPMMWNDSFDELLAPIKDQILGYKISGAGGGGYLVIISEHDIEGVQRIKIKRSKML